MQRLGRVFVTIATTLVLSHAVDAQMGGGSHGGMGSGSGSSGSGTGSMSGGMGSGSGSGTGSMSGGTGCGSMGSGTGMGSMAGGTGMGDMGTMNGMDAPGRLVVASDGTALIISRTETTQTGSSTNVVLTAISPTGTELWRWSTTKGIGQIAISGASVYLIEGGMDPASAMSATAQATAQPTAALVALRLANGTETWRVSLDGIGMNIQTGTDRLLLLVSVPMAQGSGSGSTGGMSRKVVAVDFNGRILWSLSLNS